MAKEAQDFLLLETEIFTPSSDVCCPVTRDIIEMMCVQGTGGSTLNFQVKNDHKITVWPEKGRKSCFYQ